MHFAFADCELDVPRHELRRSGEVVHLEPQVFDVLALLLEKRDRIVSKDEILDAVWDGRIVSEAALSSRINAARKAIGDDGRHQSLIQTVHKRGFRFVAEVAESGAPEALAEAAVAPEAPAAAGEPEPAADVGAIGMPSVAVLPFVNVTGESEHEYFAYGLTEDVIRLLGRNRWLRVLSRHATAAYRGRALDVREIAAALRVRYVVHGSVRKLGEQVRIAAELVSAGDARQLWSEAYEFELPEIFDVQESMARQIAAVVEPELASVEQEIASRKPPASLDAWDCYQRGFWHLWGFTKPGFDEAEAMFRRAIEIEPGLARAHAGLAYVQLLNSFYRGPVERPHLIGEAMQAAKTAVALDNRDTLSRCMLGRVYCLQQRYDDAGEELEEAIAINPSFAQAHFALAFTLVWMGRCDEAVALIDTACALSPRDPNIWIFHHTRALAHFWMGELDSAEVFARQASRHPNATPWPFATLASVLGHLGRLDEAAETVAELAARRPGYTEACARDDLFFCADRGFIERYVEGLRRAGVAGEAPGGARPILLDAPRAAAGRKPDKAAARR
jgi:TolB-like protein/Flp pilus assembly protein TadD